MSDVNRSYELLVKIIDQLRSLSPEHFNMWYSGGNNKVEMVNYLNKMIVEKDVSLFNADTVRTFRFIYAVVNNIQCFDCRQSIGFGIDNIRCDPCFRTNQITGGMITLVIQEEKKVSSINDPSRNSGFAKGTPILLFNGTTKFIENIQVGDILIGDDGNPRNVISTNSGFGSLCKIKSSSVSEFRAASYIVSENHILATRMNTHKHIDWEHEKEVYRIKWLNKQTFNQETKQFSFDNKSKIKCQVCGQDCAITYIKKHYLNKHPNESYVPLSRENKKDSEDGKKALLAAEAFAKTIEDDNTLDIPIEIFKTCSQRMGDLLMGYKGDCVNWPSQKVLLDGWVMGEWLGDGMQTGYSMAINVRDDPEILEYLKNWGKNNDALFTHDSYNEYSYNISSIEHRSHPHMAPLRKLLKMYNLLDTKFIPPEYLFNDRQTRLAILAGLIDSDGYVQNGTRITIDQGMVHERLANDIIFLARSLGFMCSHGTYKHGKSLITGEPLQYISARISGNNINDIPTVVARKRCYAAEKEVMNTGKLKIEKVNDGEFYGIRVNENGRFVLGDFTVVYG